MNKLLLSLLAFTFAIAAWANPSGKYHITSAHFHYVSDSYKFSDGEDWVIESASDEKSWDCEITANPNGTISLYNLLGYEETLTSNNNPTSGKFTIPAQVITYENEGERCELGICGGIKDHTGVQNIMNYVDSSNSYVMSKVHDIEVSYNQTDNTFNIETPILIYTPHDTYEGYVGFAYALASELTIQKVTNSVTLTVNEAAGVDVKVDTEDDVINVYFDYGQAEVKDAQYIRIYNVYPYIITSVKVNGKEIAAIDSGEYYYIEANAATKTINITVEEQLEVGMLMTVTVNGLNKFENLVIMGKHGAENGTVIARESQLWEGEAVWVWFTNFDLPLQVFGSWSGGKDYKMTVTLDGETLVAAQGDNTSALFKNLEPTEGSQMTISLTDTYTPAEKVTLTVNEAAGIKVIVDTEEDVCNVDFVDGNAEVEGAQYIRIFNVEPYLITSVKVNGEEIAAEEAGNYYFIEMKPSIQTIAIEVEEQEVVEMLMMVTVNGLEKFQNLTFFAKNGENGNALARESELREGEAVWVYCYHSDLPIQVFGSWADGTDYKMSVTLNGENIVAAQEGPTSARFMNIEPADGSNIVISLTGSILPAETVTLTVNDVNGVNVVVDTEDDVKNVEFVDGNAEVEGVQYIRIFNVEPYLITSVKVNGEEIAAVNAGEYYLIEVNAATKTIAIEVEEQEVVEMSMMVYIQGIDKFESLVIMDKYGENGRFLAYKDQLAAGAFDGEVITEVCFTNFDLPLQIYGTWANGTNYKMEVTIEGVLVQAVQEGPTSALYKGINIENEQFLTISLNVPQTVIESIRTAANADRQVLQTMKSDLETATQNYSAYVDQNQYNSLLSKINELDAKVTEAYNNAINSGKYTTPWSKDAIETLQSDVAGFIQGLKDAQQAAENNKIIEAIRTAANADRQAVNTVRTEWERIATQVSKDYPAVYVIAFNDAKLVIDTKLNDISAAIDSAESTAVNSLQAYETPSVTKTLEEINGLITAYQQNVKATYEKAKTDADAAVAKDRQTLQTLKDKVEKAALDYSAYVNKTEYNALIKSIEDWGKKVTEAYNKALTSGNYSTPWTPSEIAALEKSVNDFIQRLVTAKEADTNQHKVEEITKAANADREKVQSLRRQWEQVLDELNQKYPNFTLAFDKANIDTKFSKVSSDIDAAQKKAIEDLTSYVSPSVDSALSEIRGLIEKYQKDVEAAVQKIKDDALTAANADRTTVSNAKQVAENAIKATDTKYPAFVIEADRNAIYNSYEKLMADIDNAYNKAIETLSTYVSPSVAKTLVEIDAMVTKYQRDVAAAAEAAKTEATKLADADKASLTALSEQVEQINAKYSALGCIETQKVNAINASIQALRAKIDAALTDVYTIGSYKSPLTESDLQNIRKEISELETDCKSRLEAAIEKAAQADRDKVSSLKTQYDNLIKSLENEYNAFRDLDQEKAIAELFNTISERINQAAAKAKVDSELYVSPDVDNYLKNTITAQMNAYRDEVLRRASGTMTEAEKAAQQDKKILTDLKSELDEAIKDYSQYVDETVYNELCARIQEWITKVDQAKENAKQTGQYVTPWSENELKSLQNDANDFITTLKKEKELDLNIAAAAQADRNTLGDKKKILDEVISETNKTYPAFANSESKTIIDQMFSTLSSEIEQAEQDALQQRSAYTSPSVGDKLSNIESMVEKYSEDVAAAAEKAMAHANTQADIDRELLNSLKDQVENTYNTYNELNCVDQNIKETKDNIDIYIKDLDDLINPALNTVYTIGYYSTPWTDATIEGIQYTIGLFKEACNERYKVIVNQYADSDRATVAAKQDEYLDLNSDVHKVEGLLWEAEHEAMEKNIAKMFTDILEVINKVANEAVDNAEPYNNEDVLSFLLAIEDEIKAYKQSLIDQITVNEAITLNECEKTLQDIYEYYHDLYADVLEENGYYDLEEQVSHIMEMLNQAGETALNPTIEYDGSEVAEEIKIVTEDINSLEYLCRTLHYETVLTAANDDLMRLSETQARYNFLIENLDKDPSYNDSRNYDMEKKVKSMLDELPQRIDQEVKDAIDNHHAYNSLEETFEEINNWIETYEKLVKGLTQDELTNDEIDSLVAIESEVIKELENRLDDIFRTYEEYINMGEYEDLWDALSDLNQRLEDAREEAYDSHQYTSPWEEGEIEELRTRIDQLEKEAKEEQENGIAKVEADPETEAIYYDLNGRLIKNPASGKLYIRILGGKAQKVII